MISFRFKQEIDITNQYPTKKISPKYQTKLFSLDILCPMSYVANSENNFWARMVDKNEVPISVQVLGVTLRYTAWINDKMSHELNACHTTLSVRKNLTEQGTKGRKQTDPCYWQTH